MKSNQPSATSLVVALGQLCMAREFPHLTTGESTQIYEKQLQFAPFPAKMVAMCTRFYLGARILRFLMDLFIPGLFLHQTVRKHLIEREVVRCLQGDCKQVVILGAGLDTLGFRLAHKTKVFEIDHPATQRIKQALKRSEELTGQSGNPSERLPEVFHSADLCSSDLRKVFAEMPGFDPHLPTVFVMEGVTMYLEEPALQRILESIRDVAAEGSIFILTFLEPDKKGRARFTCQGLLTNLWLSWQREPFRFGIDRQALAAFLGKVGWTLCDVFVTSETLAQASAFTLDALEQGCPAVLAEGEYIALARR